MLKNIPFLKQNYLYEPIGNSQIILFRIVFGFLIAAEAWGAIATGWVKKTFIDPDFTFTFIGFEFLQPLPGDGMYYYFFVMGLAGILVMLGLFYRFSVVVYLVMWTSVYLMQKSHYNNHYYLLVLLLGIMVFMPAANDYSLDARGKNGVDSKTCPRWVPILFICQLAIVYTYAGFSKVYGDWLLAKPISIWFAMKSDYWLIGDFLQHSWLQFLVAYGGIFFDCLIVPALLWKKTRKLAFGLSIFFHLFNSVVFQIGIFPYLAIALNVFFFPPETIQKLFFRQRVQSGDVMPRQRHYKPAPAVVVYMVIAYFLLQVLLPIRYHLFPGNVHWTEEGHRLAWKMMLRTKSANIRFRVDNLSTGEQKSINPRDFITPDQYSAMASKPDMIWQFIQHIKMRLAEQGWDNIAIYANSNCSLNGGPYQPLIKPDYDLADVKWHRFRHADWIQPLQDLEEQ